MLKANKNSTNLSKAEIEKIKCAIKNIINNTNTTQNPLKFIDNLLKNNNPKETIAKQKVLEIFIDNIAQAIENNIHATNEIFIKFLQTVNGWLRTNQTLYNNCKCYPYARSYFDVLLISETAVSAVEDQTKKILENIQKIQDENYKKYFYMYAINRYNTETNKISSINLLEVELKKLFYNGTDYLYFLAINTPKTSKDNKIKAITYYLNAAESAFNLQNYHQTINILKKFPTEINILEAITSSQQILQHKLYLHALLQLKRHQEFNEYYSALPSDLKNEQDIKNLFEQYQKEAVNTQNLTPSNHFFPLPSFQDFLEQSGITGKQPLEQPNQELPPMNKFPNSSNNP